MLNMSDSPFSAAAEILAYYYGSGYTVPLHINASSIILGDPSRGNANVGVGIAAPSCRLEVISNDNTDSGNALKIWANNQTQACNYSFGGLTTTYYYRIQTATNQVLSLQPGGGTVSIGTTAAGDQLLLAGYGAIGMATGNAKGYVTHQFMAANSLDCLSLAVNFRRTDWSAGTIVSTTMGTSDIQVAASASGGWVVFNIGGVNAIPTERMRIDSTGNVGIGCNNPLNTLCVINPTSPSAVTGANQITVAEPSNNSAYRLNIGMYIYGGTRWTGAIQMTAGGPAGGVLVLQPSGGILGVGTETPNAGVLMTLQLPGNAGAFPTPGTASGKLFIAGNDGTWGTFFGTYGSGAGWIQAMRTDGNGSVYPILLNPSGGGVGIGLTGASYALDVNGQIHASGGFVGPMTITPPLSMSYNWNPAANTAAAIQLSDTGSGGNGGGITLHDTAAGNYGGIWMGSGNMMLATGGTASGFATNNGTVFTTTTGIGIGVVPNSVYILQLNTDTAYKTITGAWIYSSDARIKRNIRNLEGGLSVINRLRPIEAEFNGLGGTVEGQRTVSVIAQEIREILPHTVGVRRAKLHPDDQEDTDLLDFNPHELWFQLILAVQQLSGRLEELEKRHRLN
jgi:hypothetical protein